MAESANLPLPRRAAVVIGDTIIDKTVPVVPTGMCKEDGAALQLAYAEPATYSLGGAANVAAGIAAQGAETVFFTGLNGALEDRVEADGVFNFSDMFTEARVDVRPYWYHLFSTVMNPVKERYYIGNRMLFRIDHREQSERSQPAQNWLSKATDLQTELLREINAPCQPVICLANYNKGFFAGTYKELWGLLHDHQTVSPVLVDPGNNVEEFCEASTNGMLPMIYKLNLQQIARLSPHVASVVDEKISGDTARNLAEVVRRHFHLFDIAVSPSRSSSYIWLTLGAMGMCLISCDTEKRFWYKPAGYQGAMVDTCGAGDTALAVMTAELTKQLSPWDQLLPNARWQVLSLAVDKANRAAGVAVQHRGAYVVKAKELES